MRGKQETVTRSREDRVISGYCAGLAERLGTDAPLVRTAFIMLAIFFRMLAVALYVLLAMHAPEEPAAETENVEEDELFQENEMGG